MLAAPVIVLMLTTGCDISRADDDDGSDHDEREHRGAVGEACDLVVAGEDCERNADHRQAGHYRRQSQGLGARIGGSQCEQESRRLKRQRDDEAP